MKRTYKAPTLEAKEYAQLENVFTWCDKNPITIPECYKVNEDPMYDGDTQTESCSLGPPPNNTTGTGEGCAIGSGDDF